MIIGVSIDKAIIMVDYENTPIYRYYYGGMSTIIIEAFQKYSDSHFPLVIMLLFI